MRTQFDGRGRLNVAAAVAVSLLAVLSLGFQVVLLAAVLSSSEGAEGRHLSRAAARHTAPVPTSLAGSAAVPTRRATVAAPGRTTAPRHTVASAAPDEQP